MEAIKAFGERLAKAAQDLWERFKKLPIVKPIFALAYSRKSIISAAVVTFLLGVVPQLAPAGSALEVLTVQIVGIVFVAVAQSLGISIEDAAAKKPI